MLTFFKIGLDDEATTLLMDLAVALDEPPRLLMARLIRAILIEDAEAHGLRTARPVYVDGVTYH
jgi:hypothetical protein